MNSLAENKKKNLWMYPALALSMMFCAAFTSPLYPHYVGLDSSMFLITAKGMLQGKICYLDLFDHKGPVLFWIEEAGYAIGGRTGVWILQCLFAFADLWLIGKICRLFRANAIMPSLSFFALLFYLFSHGDLTEEFCMPMILLGFYLELRFLRSQEKTHPVGWAFVYGLLFGLMAFIRVNNAVILCSLLLCIAICLIIDRHWGNLLLNLCAGVTGLAIVAIPICLYYHEKGALEDMLYATFLHNFMYAKNNTHRLIFSGHFLFYAALYLPGFFAFFLFLIRSLHVEERRLYVSLCVATTITYGMLLYTNAYEHYFVLGIPLFLAAVAVLLEGTEWMHPLEALKQLLQMGSGKRRAAGAICCGIVCLYFLLSAYSACAPIYKCWLTDITENQYRQIHESVQSIPEEERDSVIGYEVLADFYFFADIVPCYRYYTLQHWMTSDVRDVEGDFCRFVEDEKPLWVVTNKHSTLPLVLPMFIEEYSLVMSDDFVDYYRLQAEA